MISELYTELTPSKNEDCLGTLTHREYFKIYDGLLSQTQKLGKVLDDSEVNDYATNFMKSRTRYGEVVFDREEEERRTQEYKLGSYEADTWVELSSGECLAGNCIIDDSHPDPMASIMTKEFCKLHGSMSGLIMYRPYMALTKLREFTDEPLTDKTVELWVVMLMAHERRHSVQSASMIEKCNRWVTYVMTNNVNCHMKRDSDHRFDVAEEDANYARLDAGVEYIKKLN